MLAVGLASLVAATVVGVTAGQSLGRGIVADALRSQGTSGALEAASQLRYYERLAGQLATSRQTQLAIDEFAAAIAALEQAPPPEDLQEQRAVLLEAYQERFFQPAADAGESLQVDDILSNAAVAIILQALYSVPEEPVTDPTTVSDAGDGSDFSAAHARSHGFFRSAVVQGGLRDVLLVDAATERIVYTVAKNPDLGTSLEVGPYSGSLVARAVNAAQQTEGPVVTDVSYYRADPGQPLGAAAAPVIEDGVLTGFVVLTYDAGIYTELLTGIAEASRSADDAGPRTLYLIGPDGLVRSDPQDYLADPVAFLDAVSANGLITSGERAAVERTGTTVLVVPATGATINAAEDGAAQPMQGLGMTGAEVVTAVEEVPFEGLTWYAIAEIGSASAEATITSFRQVLLFGAAAFVVALAFLAVAWANQTMRPVRIISDRLSSAAIASAARDGVQPVEIPQRSPIEFHRLAGSLTEMGRGLHRQQEQLQQARAERLQVMERMLPPAVAQRIARGEIENLDEVPSATVVVVVVLGLGGLVAASSDGDRPLLDELHAELDDRALEHGLNRIKVLGDSYFAACGHDQPYIDHAPRAVAFAEAVHDAVASLSRLAPVRLTTAIGLTTGPVTVGMSGGARLVYDVWGPTVTTAHQLARSAQPGQIVITEATRARLPEEIEVTPWRGSIIGAEDEPADGQSALWAVTLESQPHSGTGVRP